MLQQEVRELAIYNAIISTVATGSTKLSEISSKVGEETSACSAYLKNLISLGIIKKETPFAFLPIWALSLRKSASSICGS